MGWYARRVFAPLMDRVLATEPVEDERRAALAPLGGRVLEIGFGTGLNLRFFPPAVNTLTVIDSEAMLPDRIALRIAEVPWPVEQIRMDATQRLPFPDETFDGAVTTLTLCSLDEPIAALRELHRVLKPSGRYVFFEHGRSEVPSVARWQDRLNGLQRVVACGCNLNRRIDQLIQEGGFRIVELVQKSMPGSPRIMSAIYRGLAVK
jgi:ubiquinone/menaquinone biosynthesis C-methylase UbiE